MPDHRNNSLIWLLAGVAGGAAAGIVAGILYAPRSGDETRQLLHSKASEKRERLHHHAKRLRDRATEWADHSRDFLKRRNKSRSSGDSAPKAVEVGRATAGTVSRVTDVAS